MKKYIPLQLSSRGSHFCRGVYTFAKKYRVLSNVIKTIASMTKKKAHLLYTKQIGGLFHVFMDISQFAFMFPMSINVTVMNVYLSVLSDNLRIGFINWNLRL